MTVGLVSAVTTGALVLFGLGQALGAKGRAQRAADLAAVSAGAAMRRVYPRLFEPAYLPSRRRGLPPTPNPRHLPREACVALARAAATTVRSPTDRASRCLICFARSRAAFRRCASASIHLSAHSRILML